MKNLTIKLPVTDEQRQYIENTFKTFDAAIEAENKKHNAEISKLNKLKKDFVDFWASNTKPIYHFREKRVIDIAKSFETKTVWAKTGHISSSTLEEVSEWVCQYCKAPVETKFIATGHDHTDYRYDICDCVGAQKNGRPYNELN